MKVSIIIPHYSDLESLALCLSSLERQTFAPDDREIIVADNASPQGPEAVANVIANRARLVVVREKGAGPARNGGVAASSGEILAFLDSDCQARPQWLERGIAALSHYDIVGGPVEVLVQNPSRVSGTEAFERVFAFNIERYVTKKGFAATCNLFCTRRVFDVVGGFDVGVSEDVDWSHRAARKSFRIGYESDAVVGHPARRNWEELQRKWVRVNRETYALTTRGPWGRTRWMLRSMLLPLSALAHTPKVMRSDRLHGIRQKAAALGVLYRLRFWRFLDSISLLMRT